ncbi:MAG: endonuclease [Bacteroidales bacterium]|nr:endonuclease [Bacteroidales bacterium]
MKKFLLLTYLIVSGMYLGAQIPEHYYDGTDALRGQALKKALYQIIKGQTEYPYTSSSTDVWDILKETDKDTLNPDNVILFYTGWSVNAAQEYNNGRGWSREHVWAKSRGDFGTDPPAGTDAHNLRPVDVSVNSARNNRWFDTCSVAYYDNGVATGCYTSTTEWVWQPRKEVQGDVARIIFYMATRYEGENGEPDLRVIDYLPADNSTNEPVHARLSTLLRWNELDPVDAFERHRNDVIYSFQHNRNPYIDHPEFVNKIWGPDSVATGIIVPEAHLIALYPNPASAKVYFRHAENLIKEVCSMEGRVLLRSTDKMMDIGQLPKGIYLVVFKDQHGKIVRRLKLVHS